MRRWEQAGTAPERNPGSGLCFGARIQSQQRVGKNASLSPPALRHPLRKAGVRSLRLPEQGWEITPSLPLIKLGPSRKGAPLLHGSVSWMSPVESHGGYFQVGCVVSFN